MRQSVGLLHALSSNIPWSLTVNPPSTLILFSLCSHPRTSMEIQRLDPLVGHEVRSTLKWNKRNECVIHRKRKIFWVSVVLWCLCGYWVQWVDCKMWIMVKNWVWKPLFRGVWNLPEESNRQTKPQCITNEWPEVYPSVSIGITALESSFNSTIEHFYGVYSLLDEEGEQEEEQEEERGKTKEREGKCMRFSSSNLIEPQFSLILSWGFIKSHGYIFKLLLCHQVK